MNGFDSSRPVSELTVGELFDLLEKHFGIAAKRGRKDSVPQAPAQRMLYGIKGLEDFFHVSHRTAQKYKDTFLKPIVNQNGRVIVIPADEALRLFNENKESHADVQ